MRVLLYFAFVLICCTLFVHAADKAKLKLIDTQRFPKALCLDGSPGGRNELKFDNPDTAHKVFMHLDGGAWCHSEANCYDRSLGALGSSKSWPTESSLDNLGVFSPNCQHSPMFCNITRHNIKYCDGCSFGGTASYTYNNTLLTSYGDYILSAHLTEIFDDVKARMDKFSSTKAPEIIVSGCSAGGLASFANTWKIIETAKRYFKRDDVLVATIPCSGLFPNVNTIANQPNYPNIIRGTYRVAKPRYAPTDTEQHPCFDLYSDEDKYKCLFAENHLKLFKSPVFVIQSVVDSWSIPCIFTSIAPLSCGKIPEWANCVYGTALQNCTSSHIDTLSDKWVPIILQDLNPDLAHYSSSSQLLQEPVMINGEIIQYYDLLSEIARENGRQMFSYIDPMTQRVHIEYVQQDYNRLRQQLIQKSSGKLTRDEMDLLRKYSQQENNIVKKPNGFSLPPKSGMFLHTCYTHCEGSGTAAWRFKIDNVSIVEAVGKWYASLLKSPSKQQTTQLSIDFDTIGSADHVYLPCTLDPTSSTHQCNPTCG